MATLSDTKLESVIRDVTNANGLTNAHYTDQATFELETRALFSRQWAALAFVHDVPGPGHVKPIEFLGQPLLLASDRDGTIRVFYNVCRHRGMVLVDEPREVTGALRCPYHSWCYDLAGKLRATPHVGGPGQNVHDAINNDKLGLVEVRSHIWRGIVFVNMDGHASAFETANVELMERWSEFEKPLHFGGADSTFELKLNTNWKLAVENYCESYHLPWVHPALNSYSRLEDHYNIESPNGFSGQGTHVYRQLKGDDGTLFPDLENLAPKWDAAAEYIALYPNVLLGVHRDHSFAIILVPDGPTKTTERIALFYHQSDAASETYASLRIANTEQWKVVFEEDVFVVEGMQRGRNADGFDGGRFSPVMDGPTHNFHQWVASNLINNGQS
ncbi:MAG: aromatic ring-hydroxylating dioxygenase subunit alpha [Pseudomonadota bacterium]